jgi:hypothetical protein
MPGPNPTFSFKISRTDFDGLSGDEKYQLVETLIHALTGFTDHALTSIDGLNQRLDGILSSPNFLVEKNVLK